MPEVIKPQEGPQELFMSTKADICIFGGSGGGGKSWAILAEPLRHLNNPLATTIIFRKTTPQIRAPGGLLAEGLKLYSKFGAECLDYRLTFKFKSGMEVRMAHLESDADVYSWQGSALPIIMYDELTHFTEFQFFYMLSRNRSLSGIPAYVRATTNPDSNSWVRKLIDWWINPETGLAIPERSGVLRWFIRQNDEIIWADTKEELENRFGIDCMPKSLTFIRSSIYDNKILLSSDKGYLANLKALDRVSRERLLDGNWNSRPSAGNYFKREYFQVIDTLPSGYIQTIRGIDRASTKPNPSNTDPDWTRLVKMHKYRDNTIVISDLRSLRDTPLSVENLIKNTASQDGYECKIMCQCDPGSSGKAEADQLTRMLMGYMVKTPTFSKDKITRAKAFSSAAEAGNIKILRGAWNEEFFKELENFPDGRHDDIIDACSIAFNELFQSRSILDAL